GSSLFNDSLIIYHISAKMTQTNSDNNSEGSEDMTKQANHLIHEKSPYLLQHAYNPVNWYPWNDEAFTKAKEEDKPIFFKHRVLNLSLVSCHGA
ncbi:DUF255 domain-containing protein, partial [Turicibacter sp. HGF1]|uniref:DUF255 domain-containing protein n=1 Tax=Turicibacter sp. HGF1 TaxID=910310 RepID=UPI001EE67283